MTTATSLERPPAEGAMDTATNDAALRRKRRRKERWSWAVGQYGNRVLVFAERNGRLYGQIRGVRRALKHSDRERAKQWARDQEKKLRDGAGTAADPPPTVAKVFAAYLARETPRKKSRTSRGQDERTAKMFTRVFGGKRDLSKLTPAEWCDFIDARLSGAIDARGQPVLAPQKSEDPKRRPVRARTVEADLEWLRTVIRWACTWRDKESGQYLMREDPTRGREFTEKIPHEQNPRRPVATQDRYEALRAVAHQVTMEVSVDGKAKEVRSYLPELLDLANGTGRRINAICALRYADLRLAKSKGAPHGAIQWPGETDKMGKAWAAPINAAVRATIDRILAARPGVGAAYLFPAPKNPAQPVDRYLAAKWLRRAERLAKLPHLKGGVWHPFRRKWGTERKHLPIQDVAQAGGWKNHEVLETVYQQPDAATLYRVVSEPAELREAEA